MFTPPPTASRVPDPIKYDDLGMVMSKLGKATGHRSMLGPLNGYDLEYNLINMRAMQREKEIMESGGASAFRAPENELKNRYLDILPFDETRVILPVHDGLGTGDYINADYIDHCFDDVGAAHPGFIAAQGPLTTTIDDFWRMIWSERPLAVLMLTRLVELDRPKCEMYWPETDQDTFCDGQLQVTRDIDVDSSTDLVRVTDFTITRLPRADAETQAKDVGARFAFKQYWYREWPDHGAPATPDVMRQLLATLIQVEDAEHAAGRVYGRPLIHCSAGVGRTGTFVAAHMIARKLRLDVTAAFAEASAAATDTPVDGASSSKSKGSPSASGERKRRRSASSSSTGDCKPPDPVLNVSVNIFGVVEHLRKQRPWMVQSNIQYAFLYQVVRAEWMSIVHEKQGKVHVKS